MSRIKKIKCDVSVCITLHKENSLAQRTLINVDHQIKYAQSRGVAVEVLLHLDRPNSTTRRLARGFNSFSCMVHTYENSFGDPGLSRNFLIKKANGKYLAFIDADDYFTQDWLWLAWQRAKKVKKPSVFSPEKCIYFNEDGIQLIHRLWQSNDLNFYSANAIVSNPILSANFVHNEIYKSIKYRPNSQHYGYEDWRWNLDILAAGYKILTVPKTIFFYRLKKNGSVNLNSHKESKTVGKSLFFKPSVFLQLYKSNKSSLKDYFSVTDEQENTIRVTNTRNSSIRRRSIFTSPKLLTKRYIITRYGGESYLYRLCRDSYDLARTVFSVPVFGLLEELGLRDVQKKYSYNSDLNKTIRGQLIDLLTKKELHSYNQISSLEPQLKPMLYQNFVIEDIFKPLSVKDIYASMCKVFNGKIEQIYILDNVEAGSEEHNLLLHSLSTKKNVVVLVLSELSTEVRTSIQSEDINILLLDNLTNLSSIDHLSMLIMIVLDNWRQLDALHCFPGEFASKVIVKYDSHILKSHRVVWHICEERLNTPDFGKVSLLINDKHSVNTEKEKVCSVLLNSYGIKNINFTKQYNSDITNIKTKNSFVYSTNNRPETTVIMPVYNADEFLEPAIQSILQQSYKHFELLIINDGSTDKSQEIIDKYAELDKRIRIIKQKNKGLVYTLNHAIKSVKTTYIARMDADDISTPERLEKQISYLKSHPNTGVVGCLTQNITYDGTYLDINVRPVSPECLELITGAYCQLAGPSIVARRNCLLDSGLFRDSEYPAEDYGYWTRIVLQKRYSLYLIPQVLYYYRINQLGISHTLQINQINATANIGNYFRQYSIINGYNYASSTLFRKWIDDASKMPDDKTRAKLINDYIQIVYSYVADQYKINKIQTAHSINTIKNNIIKVLGTEEAEEFNKNIMMLLTGKQPYAADKKSFVTMERSNITIILFANKLTSKLRFIESSKLLKNARVIILCSNKTNSYKVWSKLHITNISLPFVSIKQTTAIRFALEHVQTPYVFFFNNLSIQHEEINTLYKTIKTERLDIISQKKMNTRVKNTYEFGNFLALSSFVKLLLYPDKRNLKIPIMTILAEAEKNNYSNFKTQ